MKRTKTKKAKPIFTIRFIGTVNEENTSEFLKLFDEVHSQCKNIRIIINSDGGDPDCALAIYDAIIRSNACVETIAEGCVASAAVIIYLAGGKRFITSHSSIMVHKSKVAGPDGMTIEEVKLVRRRLYNIENVYTDLICEKTRQSRRKVLGDIRRGRYICAEEAVKTGYAHKII